MRECIISKEERDLYLRALDTNSLCKVPVSRDIKNVRRNGGIKMINMIRKSGIKKTGIFAAGVLFGTAGIRLLSSKDAKKAYTQCAAAALRAKECVMKTVTTIQENAEDIYAEAQQINEARAEKERELANAEAKEAGAEE